MRFSRGCLGIFSLVVIVIMSGLCSVVAYASMRGVVIDLWDSGSRVGSIGEVAQAVINPNAVQIATHVPGLSFTLPTLTPVSVIPTAVPQTVSTIDPNVTPDTTLPTSDPVLLPQVTAAPTQDTFISQTWEDPRQIRILLLGIDQRKGYEQETVFRSDTIILVNIDPVRKTAGVLSFPRDLWVTIPGAGQQRINEAMRQGDYVQYPGGGGPALAAETIAYNFGIRVDRYVVVNFNLFESVIDTLAPEGVEICITEAIHDDHYPDVGYGFLDVKFDPGCQRLNSTRLLQFARTRHTTNSDFDRAKRQQQTLEAVRTQLLNAGGITRFATQIPTLWNELKDNYRTNLSLDEIVKLGNLMMEIPKENIRYATIDVGDIAFGKSEAGEDILLPIMSDIGTKIESVLYPQIGGGNAPVTDTTSNNTVTAGSSADLLTKMASENATIYVYNGTDIPGLASKTQEWLIGKGIRITTAAGNAAGHNSQPTLILDYGGTSPNTAQYLAQLLGVPASRVQPGVDGLVTSGVVVIAGPDVQTLLTGGQ